MTPRLFICAAISVIVSATAAFMDVEEAPTLRRCVLGAALGILVIYDLRERRIPNWIALPATLLCFALDMEERINWRALASALTIVGILLMLALVQPRALGMGDVKLALLIAVGLPAAATPALVSGLLIASLCGCALAVSHHRRLADVAVPLAPFLALGVLVTLV